MEGIRKVFIDFILKTNSEVFSIVIFIVMMIGMFIARENMLYVTIVFIIILPILNIIRIINRTVELKKGLYFLDYNHFIVDARKRADQWGDLAITLVCILMLMSLNNEFFKDFGNSAEGIVFLSIIFFVSIAGVSISKNSVPLKIVTILLSTIQGIFFILIVLANILGLITSGTYIMGDFFDAGQMIDICYIIETSLNEYMPIVIGGVLINILYITFTPPYQLDRLAFTYKVVNLGCIFISLVVFWKANSNIDSINVYIESMRNSLEVMRWREYSEYMNSFSKSNITNTIYIILLPYTFSIVCNGLYIEILKKRYEKKCKMYLDILMQNIEDNHSYIYTKRYYEYYGGDEYKVNILNKLKEVNL